MFRKFAWMPVLMVIVLVAGVVGCASDPASRSKSARDDAPAASSSPGRSCH